MTVALILLLQRPKKMNRKYPPWNWNTTVQLSNPYNGPSFQSKLPATKIFVIIAEQDGYGPN